VDKPNLKGAWIYRSYLTNPPNDLTPLKPAEALWWAAGKLDVTQDEGGFEAKLTFPTTPPVVLDVKGTIEVGANGGLPGLKATGTTQVDSPAGGKIDVVYEIAGWVVSDTPGSYERDATSKRVQVKNPQPGYSIRGSVRNMTLDLGGAPAGTVGTFVLVRSGN
jgi:hypothetical protein